MIPDLSNIAFYKELESSLPQSAVEIRRKWAAAILENDIDIKYLSGLLKSEQKTATRFLWLLSEIGQSDPNKLLYELPFLLKESENLDTKYKTSFATFWLLAGVPLQDEGKALDLLFQWLLSNETNVTIKSRSLIVLYRLTKKYPELRNELSLCLKDQMHKNTNTFEKRANKILIEMSKARNNKTDR